MPHELAPHARELRPVALVRDLFPASSLGAEQHDRARGMLLLLVHLLVLCTPSPRADACYLLVRRLRRGVPCRVF